MGCTRDSRPLGCEVDSRPRGLLHLAQVGSVDKKMKKQLARIKVSKAPSQGKLTTAAKKKPLPGKPQTYDMKKFFAEYRAQFGKLVFGTQVAGMEQLMVFIENDKAITNTKWIAYMLATVKIECTRLRKVGNKKRYIAEWTPVTEQGTKSYFERSYDVEHPNIKLWETAKLITYTAECKKHGVTIKVEDIVTTKTSKKTRKLYHINKQARSLGNTHPGDGYKFRGRGYVQITGRWNYKNMGKLIGVDLLAKPELALVLQTAYNLMSYGMRNGSYRGGNKLSDFTTAKGGFKYADARDIINGDDKGSDLEGYAKKFEKILKAGKKVTSPK